MMMKKILAFCMIVLAVTLVSAYSAPDMSPILNFLSNAQTADNVAVLTAVAVDSLTNAGIVSIEIYQDNALLEKKDCSGVKTCTFTKTVIETNPVTHEYSAKVKDLGGNTVESGKISITFKGILKSVNLPPSFERIGSRSVNENALLQFIVSGSDPNDDPLTYSASGLPSGANFNAGTKTFSWTPSAGQAGNYPVTFKVSDGVYEYSEAIAISVVHANNPPVLDSIGNKQTGESQLLQFVISGSDPDNDTLVYSASNLPSGASFNAGTKTFSWTPSTGQSGNYQVTFTVSDGSSSDSETITITVGTVTVNQPPVLASIGNKQVNENALLQFTVSATDPNNDSLTYSALNLPSGANFNAGTKTFSWTPSTGQSGNYQVTFNVTDGSLSDYETITITVGNANRPPVLSSIGNKNVNENQLLQFIVNASDPDNNTLTYSASNLPSGALFNAGTKTFSWTPGYNQSGNYQVTFNVSDGILFDDETITITVANVNQPPVLASIGNKTLNENTLIQLTISATDADNDTLAYSALNLPSGASFNPSTKTFSWVPNYAQSGSYNVTFNVTDGSLADYEAIKITVNDVQRSFEFNGSIIQVKFSDCSSYQQHAIGGLFDSLISQVCNPDYSESTEDYSTTATLGKNLTFDVTLNNPDNNGFDYKWKVKAIGGLFSSLTQGHADSGSSLSLSQVFNETGNYAVSLNVTDIQGACFEKTWNVSIEDWTAPPSIYGQATDIDTGLPLAGINISVYDSSVFNPETNDTNEANNYALLQPKTNPDTFTDSQGRYVIYRPIGGYFSHLVFQGSRENDFNVKDKTNNKIILPRTGQVRVYFESASAFLKSDLYIITPTNQMLVANSSVGNQSYVGPFSNGTELRFAIKVHGQPMGLGEYFHDSNSTYAKITQIDNDTWRLFFEDLPSNKADWDYNDAVALVDMAQNNQTYNVTLDCDQDGIPNWQDINDSGCDVGEHNTEISENISTANFNAEGHIVHSGKYENDNNYTCGDYVYFTMFGVNNGGTSETITFDVQDHTQGGNPNSPIVYNGSISNATESLTVLAGQKANKMFKFKVPCSYAGGKYDIHILWKNETWHKIGNFFVVPDTTIPYVYAWDSLTTYTNESLEIPCDGENFPQPGTIGYNEQVYYFMMEGYNEPKWGVTVCVDKDINTDGPDPDSITDNDQEACMVNPPRFIGSEDLPVVNYSKSGHYTAKIFAFDESGNTNSTYTNITVYATENEANATAKKVYDRFYYNDYEQYNYTYWIASQIRNFKIAVDRWDINATNIGDEYITPTDGFNGPNGINYTEIAAAEEANFHFPLGQFVKPIYSMTIDEYNYTLTTFCYHVMCNAGQMLDGQPDCHSENFAPQILRCTPYGGPTGLYTDTYGFTCIPRNVTMTSASTTQFGAGGTWGMGFERAVIDPNGDPITVQWYLDGSRITNTADTNYIYMANDNYSLSLVGNSSLVGSHKVKVMAFDFSGINKTIPNGPSNYHEWDVTITS